MANTQLNVAAPANPLAVNYEADGTRISLDADTVKRYLVRGDGRNVTDQELMLFMHTVAALKLNPFINGETYLVKYGSGPAQLVIGKGAYIRRAYENPNYIGMESGITVYRSKEGTVVQKQGTCLYPMEQLLGGWCRVHYIRAGKEREYFKEVALGEYNKNQSSWKSMPSVMIEKCAMVAALRTVFPKDFEGGYDQDELVMSGAVPPEVEDIPVPCVPDQVIAQQETVVRVIDPEEETVSKEQRQSMFAAIKSKYPSADAANAKLKELIREEGYDSTNGMKRSAYSKVMDKILQLPDPVRQG